MSRRVDVAALLVGVVFVGLGLAFAMDWVSVFTVPWRWALPVLALLVVVALLAPTPHLQPPTEDDAGSR